MVQDREPRAEVPSHPGSATVHRRLLLPRGTALEPPRGSRAVSRLCLLWCVLLGAGQDPAEPHPGDGEGQGSWGFPPSDGARSPWGFASWDYVSFCIVLSVGFFLLSHLRLPSPRSLAGLSAAKRKFADSLNEFKFRCIGDAETDDEICIGESCALPGAALKPHSRALGGTRARMPN